ncbi:hypothetical protein [uncultured Chryseobacterium sp.]|nr:hypothetical protein [uncultured Chryseobacterium sp.]
MGRKTNIKKENRRKTLYQYERFKLKSIIATLNIHRLNNGF